MKDYGTISSKRDIRNKRRRRSRRRQSVFRRFLCIGAVVLAVGHIVIGIVKQIHEKNEKIKNNKENQQNIQVTEKPSETEEQTTLELTYNSQGEVVQTDVTHAYDGRRIVCIDAGHGGADPGAEGVDGSLEKDDCLNVSLALQKKLEEQKVEVFMTRTSDVDLERNDRYNMANNNNADLFISLHRNALENDTESNGFEAWVHSTKPEAAIEAATLIQDSIAEIEGVRDRGVKFGSQTSETEDLFINNHCKGPSVLLELGFITNEGDNKILRDGEDELAQKIADAIVRWMDDQGL